LRRAVIKSNAFHTKAFEGVGQEGLELPVSTTARCNDKERQMGLIAPSVWK